MSLLFLKHCCYDKKKSIPALTLTKDITGHRSMRQCFVTSCVDFIRSF